MLLFSVLSRHALPKDIITMMMMMMITVMTAMIAIMRH